MFESVPGSVPQADNVVTRKAELARSRRYFFILFTLPLCVGSSSAGVSDCSAMPLPVSSVPSFITSSQSTDALHRKTEILAFFAVNCRSVGRKTHYFTEILRGLTHLPICRRNTANLTLRMWSLEAFAVLCKTKNACSCFWTVCLKVRSCTGIKTAKLTLSRSLPVNRARTSRCHGQVLSVSPAAHPNAQQSFRQQPETGHRMRSGCRPAHLHSG